eukprot:TRINITY_DN9845_c0_g1_i1.p1 TRINITY_DN9845_c0_g1~~TRINITY_DN9845_c0_g1_i1.p1  ORF type:complete len:104 (+),score=39.69 TRINITY_DN9845_c0_g1_i1:62-373(+)
MGRKRKQGSEDEEEDVEEESPKRSKGKKASAVDEDGTVVCELSKNRRVTVRSFKGTVFVDIREFYEKNDVWLPGKKGISLTVDQWKALKKGIAEIDRLVTEAT